MDDGLHEEERVVRPFGDRPDGLRFLCASVVGLAFFWQFFRFSRIRELFSFVSVGLSPSEAVSCDFFVCATYVAMLAAALAFLASKRVAPPPPALVNVTACAAAVANLWGVAMHETSGVGVMPVFAAFVAALNGATALFLLLAWGDRFVRSRLRLRTLMEALGLSLLTSFVWAILCLLAPGLGMWLSALMLPASAVALAVATGDDGGAAERGGGECGAGAVGTFPSVSAKLFASLVALLVAAIAIGGTTSMFVSDDGLAPYAVHGCTVALAVALILACLFARNFIRLLYAQWLLASLTFVAGLLLMAFGGDGFMRLGVALSTAGRAVIELLLFTMCVLNPRQMRTGTSRMLAVLFVVPEVLATLLGRTVVPALLAAAGVSAEAFIATASVAMGLLLLMCLIAWLSSNALSGVEARGGRATETDLGGPGGYFGPASPDRCGGADSGGLAAERLGRAFGLTGREADVALLLARGYSYQKVSDVICLSKGTVQSHAKSIYHKLGVHSRQELIDALERQRQV